MGKAGLLAWDFSLAFLWVSSGSLIKLLIVNVFGLSLRDPAGEALKCSLAILNMFFFAWMGKITSGAAYNPLPILSSAMSAKFPLFLFTLLGRIPAQIFGSVIGVRLIMNTFPEVGRGPRLRVDLHQGALTEGLLTFMVVIVSLGLKVKDPKSFFVKTWISSISKLTLHILGADLTGGCMNPASAFGWAYARGDYMTKEHLYVYWLAPLEASLLAAWIFSLVVQPQKQTGLQEESEKIKSD